MTEFSDDAVTAAFAQVPAPIRRQWKRLRQLVFDVAEGLPDVGPVSETLRWGEPAYVCASGSTIRLGWKPQTPERYALLFSCQSKLVSVFREVYAETFCYSGNRAIEFELGQPIPQSELEHCISLALRYKRVRKLPLLGA